MNAVEIVNPEPIIDLLRRAAPGQSQRLRELFARLEPVIRLDRGDDRSLFRASRGNPNAITIGLECTCRLEAYAYVSSLLAMASSFALDSTERTRLYQSADILLNWAVPQDLRPVLLKRTGEQRSLEDIMGGSTPELPEGFLAKLDDGARIIGRRLFEHACAFILLHELAHLDLGHSGCQGPMSVLQEKDADRFAAAWLLDDDSASTGRRLSCLFGIATALLWPTVSVIYFGLRQCETHPEPYDRLFQVLEQSINPTSEAQSLGVWDLVGQILFIHMHHVGFEFDARRMQDSPREQASYLIDLLSKHVPPSA